VKTTYSLYRVSADAWRNEPYWKALNIRAFYALYAMKYYRKEGDFKSYKASEDARNFNKELTDELLREDNEQGDEEAKQRPQDDA